MILDSLMKLSQIEVIQLQLEQDQDIYDPYFVLSFDVYYRGTIPEKRRSFFGVLEMFESSPSHPKDRILTDNIPVRLEYRNLDRVETLFASMQSDLHYPEKELSYLIHRIIHGEILTPAHSSFLRLVEQSHELPPQFWKRLRSFFSSKMENCLNDLRAASLRNDPFFFHYSLGNFLKNAGALLLALNGQTEPSPRNLDRYLRKLKLLPDGFEANYTSLLRTHDDLSMERKSEVAALLTKSILGLLPSS